MRPTETAEVAAEALRDHYETWDIPAPSVAYDGSYVEVDANMALGRSVAQRVFEETGLVPIKVMHSSDLGGVLSHFDEGYRIWFKELEIDRDAISL